MPITLGIPFYNAESYLADAIRSVFAQTFQEWELLLVDDGSTDRSLEIARSVQDPRVRVISDGQNRRLPYRLNQITAEARYDLIGRMDADDLMSPTRFAKQLAILATHPEIDLVTTGVCSITNDNLPVGIRCDMKNEKITGRKLLLGQCSIVHAAILGRKSWFLRNPYDLSANLCEDYELWLRAFSKNDFNIYKLNEPLYYYREEGNVVAHKILTAYKDGPDLIRKYGHLGFGRIEQQLMIAKLHGKSFIVHFLSRINRLDFLLQLRNDAEMTDKEKYLSEIAQVLHTQVSGLEIHPHRTSDVV